MTDLERMLAQARTDLDWPPTPDLAPAVVAALGADPPRQRARTRRRVAPPLRRPLALAFALLLATAALAYAALPGLRDAVRDFLGVDSVDVERVPKLPPVTPGAGADLGLGRATTLARARERAGFEVRVPAFRSVDRVYLREQRAGNQVAFVYGAAADPLLVTQFEGDVPAALVTKLLGPGTRVERLRIEGDPAVWLTGEPHAFLYQDPRGEIVDERVRLAGDTLIWSTDGLIVRIEGADSRPEAIRIARSLP